MNVRAFLSTVAALLATGAVAACGDASMAAGAPAPEAGTTPQPEAGSGPDAATITPRPELCADLALGGKPVSELELASNAPPPLGGEIAPGAYDLVEANVYSGPPPPGSSGGDGEGSTTRLTGRIVQGTLVITPFELRGVEASSEAGADAGLTPPRARAALYRVEGTSLIETEVCPATVLPAGVPFSSVGGGLALFTDATHRLLYVRRP